MSHPANFIDLTGREFGQLTVLAYDSTSSRGLAMYKCVCKCGNEAVVAGSYLKSGDTKSCGCMRWKVGTNRYTDLKGKRFGRLTVLSDVGRAVSASGRTSGAVMWLCRCDCGTEKIVRSGNLISGNTTSCGCFNRELVNLTKSVNSIDLSGKKIGRLTVLHEDVKSHDGCRRWLCRCSCGNTTTVFQGALTSKTHQTKSCGCLIADSVHERFRDHLVGKKYGKLTVISREGYAGKRYKWKCTCECGNSVVRSTSGLTSGLPSCGCSSTHPYNGMNFRSRWELYFYMAAEISSIYTEYEKFKLRVVTDKPRCYFPDFWVPSASLFVEIKGRENKVGIAKMTSAIDLGHPIVMARKDDIEKWCGTSLYMMNAAYSADSGITGLRELLSTTSTVPIKEEMLIQWKNIIDQKS